MIFPLLNRFKTGFSIASVSESLRNPCFRFQKLTAISLLYFLAHGLPAHAQNENTPRYGGQITVGRVGVGSLMIHPLYVSLGVEREISDLVYGEGLLKRGGDGKMESGLAFAPISMERGREWIFRIQDGIRFHDGQPLTADDVVFTYTLYKQSRIYDPIFHRHFQNIDVIRMTDRRTVRFIMKEPVSEFPPALAALPILPRHQLDRRPVADARYGADIFRPIGLGPYRVETWPIYDTVILTANKTWHRGRPFLDTIVYRFFASTEELQAAFVRREVDAFEVDQASNFAALKQARPEARIQAVQPGNQAFSALFFNNTHPIFSDRTVRQALTYATDRNRIVEQVMPPDAGALANSPLGVNSWAYGGAVRYRYDPARALGMLRKAGWKDTDADGVLNSGFRSLQFELLFPRGSLSVEKMVRLIKLNLSDIGVNATPVPVDQKELVQRLRLGAYEAALFTQDFETSPDDFYSVFHSESVDLGFNMLYYRNAEVDRNIGFLFGIADRLRARPIYQRLQMLISQDQPCMFLHFINARYIAYFPQLHQVGAPGAPLNSPAVWYLAPPTR